MSQVTASQFEFEGDLQVRHKPTGTVFSTYRYAAVPDEVDVRTTHVNERSQDGTDYDFGEMVTVARQLLLEKQTKPL